MKTRTEILSSDAIGGTIRHGYAFEERGKYCSIFNDPDCIRQNKGWKHLGHFDTEEIALDRIREEIADAGGVETLRNDIMAAEKELESMGEFTEGELKLIQDIMYNSECKYFTVGDNETSESVWRKLNKKVGAHHGMTD